MALLLSRSLGGTYWLGFVWPDRQPPCFVVSRLRLCRTAGVGDYFVVILEEKTPPAWCAANEIVGFRSWSIEDERKSRLASRRTLSNHIYVLRDGAWICCCDNW
jgi:hypothetical protein